MAYIPLLYLLMPPQEADSKFSQLFYVMCCTFVCLDVYVGLGTLDTDLPDSTQGHVWNNVMGTKVAFIRSATWDEADEVIISGLRSFNTLIAGHCPSSKRASAPLCYQ